MPAFNQDEVIDRINDYLKVKHRKLKLEYGYCHGFTLLWLYKMSQGQEEWFYNTVKKIASHKGKDFDAIEMEIEKILNHIEWLQNSLSYVTDIPQLKIDKLLETPCELSLSYVFNHHEFTKILNDVIEKNKMVCLSGPSHTMGVFKRGKNYFVYDPNDDEGKPHVMTSIKELKNAIIKSLFTEFKLSSQTLPVTINIVDQQKNSQPCHVDKIKTFTKFVNTTKKVNILGADGISPLYIACESGDEDEVRILLTKGADIDHKVKDGSTALYVAAQNGFTNIVKMLLKVKANPHLLSATQISPLKAAAENGHNDSVALLIAAGAHVNQTDEDGETALSVAAEENHPDVVKTLLAAGASPTLQLQNGTTPLRSAIKNRAWDSVVLMLENIKNINEINATDLRLLRRHNTFISPAISNRAKYSESIKLHPLIKRLFKPMFDTVKTQDHLFFSHHRKRKSAEESEGHPAKFKKEN